MLTILHYSFDEDGIMLAKPNPPDIRVLNTRQRGLEFELHSHA